MIFIFCDLLRFSHCIMFAFWYGILYDPPYIPPAGCGAYICVKIPFFSLSYSSHALAISSFESCSSGLSNNSKLCFFHQYEIKIEILELFLCSNRESCWWYFKTQPFVFSPRRSSPRIGSFGGADGATGSFGSWTKLYNSFSCSAE